MPSRPDGITTVTVCADCGLLPSDLCSADYRGSRLVSAEVQASAVPKEHCTCHVEVRICTDPETGVAHLAGEYCPEETVTTRVMLAGRTYIGVPDGSGIEGSFSSIINAEDDNAHATYLALRGPCPIHDENYVPEPGLPEDEEGEGETPLPGDPDYQWPIAPFDPDTQLPQQPGEDDQSPGQQDPGQQDPGQQVPAEPSDPPVTGPGGDEGEPVVHEPEEPALPEEPVLP